MTGFQELFGTKEGRIKKTCVFLPILRKGILSRFDVKEFVRGRLYGCGDTPSFTLIHTGVGPAFSGDAVLHLEKTPCQNIILFGSCGLVKEEDGLDIGSLVTPSKAYPLEGFTQMLLKRGEALPPASPDKRLLENFLDSDKGRDIKKIACATLGSLKLEEDYVATFAKKGIQAVDMECSALFSASRYTGKKAIALFYVSDIIKKKPFYAELDAKSKAALSSSIRAAVDILCDFTEKNSGC